MPADSLATTVLIDVRFQSPMNRLHIAALESAGVRVRGVHDRHRLMPGCGFIGSEAGLVHIAMTRDGRGYRLRAFTHEPDRCDRAAVAVWAARLLELLPQIATNWE